jgi:hypothetical protein
VNGLDAHITSGRYREELIEVQCPDCEEWTTVKAISEYGALASAIVSYDPVRIGHVD